MQYLQTHDQANTLKYLHIPTNGRISEDYEGSVFPDYLEIATAVVVPR